MLLGGEMIVVAGGKRIKNLNIKNLIKWKFTAYFALGSIGKAIWYECKKYYQHFITCRQLFSEERREGGWHTNAGSENFLTTYKCVYIYIHTVVSQMHM